MVAAVAVEPVPDEVLVDRYAALVAAGLDLLVADAARWLRGDEGMGREMRARCVDAWDVLCRRPGGCPLVATAAGLAGLDVDDVWQWLWRRTLEAADQALIDG